MNYNWKASSVSSGQEIADLIFMDSQDQFLFSEEPPLPNWKLFFGRKYQTM